MNIKEHFTPKELEDYKELGTEESKIAFCRKKFSRDFGLLVYLLGYRDLGKFHDKLLLDIGKVRHLEEGSLRRFWLWARGHFKTSLITEAHTIYLIINNPDIRILIVSNTLEIAKKMLDSIKSHFMTNDEFRYFFGDLCPKPNKDGKIEFGTTEKFICPKRKRKFLKEPTCMVAGVGTNLTGLHFDFMKIDDLVTRESVTNDTQIQASKDYYASLRQLYDKPTEPKEDVIGTTYHFNDLYADIKKHKEFIKSIIPAKKEGSITFPERFSREGLDSILNDPTVGPYNFNAQYMLNPVNPEDAKFQEEWLKYYKFDEKPEELAEYICCDPASTQKKKSDYTVLQRWGVDSDGNHWLLEGVRDKFTSFQRIDVLFRMVRNARNLKWVKYEVLGGRHGDLEVINQRQQEQKLAFDVRETKSTNASKIDRIEQRLVGPYHAGKIRIPYALNFKSIDGKVYNFSELLKLEFLQFPFTEHDDILDCQSQMFEDEVIKGRKSLIQKKEVPFTADEEEKYYKRIKKMQASNPFLTKDGIRNKLMTEKYQRIMR